MASGWERGCRCWVTVGSGLGTESSWLPSCSFGMAELGAVCELSLGQCCEWRPSCARCGAFSLAVNLVWLLCSEEPFLTFMANKEILFLVRTDRAGVHKVESHGKGTNSAG